MHKPLLAILAALVIVMTGITLYFTSGYKHPVESTPASEAMPSAGSADIGGAFTLTDQNGKVVNEADFRGKVMLVFFGFTHCPDICPVTMAEITNVMEKLGADANKVAPIFITVDPKRDTSAVMKKYIANFYNGIVGLTGTQEEINKAIDAYKVYAAKQVTEKSEHHHEHKHADGDEDYQVDHSGFIYLMDKNGKYVSHFRNEDPEQTLVDAIRKQF